MTVSGLGHLVIWNNSNVTSITIPGGITNIASATTYQCSALTNVVLGYGISSIVGGMFFGLVTDGTVRNSRIYSSLCCWAYNLTNSDSARAIFELNGSENKKPSTSEIYS
jgi:hypothetical protein